MLITGGARGIGRALSFEFARHGSNIIIADIDRENMKQTASEVEARGVQVITITADMSDMDQVRTLAKEALEKAGQVDILVNNAGIFYLSTALDTPWEKWEKMLAINLHGPILLTKELAPTMMERGEGHIVNIASVAGLVGNGGYSTYATTKFGLVGFSESIRVEFGVKGVGVTAVCPGFIRTSIKDHMELRGFKEEEFQEYPWLITMSPEQAAKKIVKALRKNNRRIILTVFAKFLYSLSYWLPGPVEWMSKRVYRKIRTSE